MTTAIDQHFTNADNADNADSGFDPEMELERGNVLPDEPKKKSGNGSTIAIIGIAALAISAGGFMVMKRLSGGGEADQQVIAEAAPLQQQAQPDVIEEALVPAGAGANMGGASQADAEPSAIPAEPAAPTAPAAVSAPQPDNASAGVPANQAPAVPQPTAPAPAHTPAPAPAVAQPPAPTQPIHVMAANQGDQTETAKLGASLNEAKQKINRLEADVQKLRAELAAARQASAKPAVVRATVSPTKAEVKPAAKSADKAAAQTKQPEAKPAENTTGRNDFRIYAMRDGQAWVQDLKTRETIPAAPGSMLPDGSKVTKVNEALGVISTTAGEIRYTSLNRTH